MNIKTTPSIIVLSLIFANQNLNAMESSLYSSEESTSSSSEIISETLTITSRQKLNVKIKTKNFPFLELYIPNEIYQQCYEDFINNDFVYVNNRAYELRSGRKIKKGTSTYFEKATDALPMVYSNRDRTNPIFIKTIEANLTSEILYLNYFYNDEWYNYNGRQWGFQVSTTLDPTHVKEIKEALGLEPQIEKTTTITQTITNTQEGGTSQLQFSYGQHPYGTQILNPQFSYAQTPYGTQTFNPQLSYGQTPYEIQTITPQYNQYRVNNTQFGQQINPHQ